MPGGRPSGCDLGLPPPLPAQPRHLSAVPAATSPTAWDRRGGLVRPHRRHRPLGAVFTLGYGRGERVVARVGVFPELRRELSDEGFTVVAVLGAEIGPGLHQPGQVVSHRAGEMGGERATANTGSMPAARLAGHVKWG